VTTVEEVKITAADGCELAATTFAPQTESGMLLNISVLISSATGAPRGYYARFARFMANNGIFVTTYDYRGMFDSQRMKAEDDPATMSDWGEKDVAAVLEWLAKIHPGNKIVAVGHSIGGTLIGLAGNNHLIAKAVNVATPSGYWRHWSGLRKYERFLDWYFLMPLVVSCCGYLPARFAGGALPKGVALEWARWGRYLDFVVDERGKPMHDGFLRFVSPMFFYSFTDDHFAPPAAVDAMRRLYARAPITHRIISPSDWSMRSIGHFGFFRQSAPETVWREVLQWIIASGQ
jgi:predicted alpha/beta hydrolase